MYIYIYIYIYTRKKNAVILVTDGTFIFQGIQMSNHYGFGGKSY